MFTLLLLAALLGNRGEIHDHFDLIEVNHYHNEYGSPVFVQLIYWDWYREDHRFHAQGWLLMKDAFDMTDDQHRRAFENAVEDWLGHITDAARRSRIRSQMIYRGRFVGGRLYPIKHHRSGRYVVRFHDHAGVLRLITADHFRETYTRHDPEVEDRKFFPETARRGLRKGEVRRVKGEE